MLDTCDPLELYTRIVYVVFAGVLVKLLTVSATFSLAVATNVGTALCPTSLKLKDNGAPWVIDPATSAETMALKLMVSEVEPGDICML